MAFIVGMTLTMKAQTTPFKISDGLFDQSQTQTLGLSRVEGAERVTVFAPTSSTDKFSNGVVMAAFKGALYCMWQSSKLDEDASDTWVAYARSEDGGKTWTAPMVLCPTISNGYCSSGGWLATDDRLIAYINVWPSNLSPKGGYTQYKETTDGKTWTEPADVTMADGTRLNCIFEQDPHVLQNGRIICAGHFQTGLMLSPIYTDDPTGRTGWKKASFPYTSNGSQSVEMEPSFYVRGDGALVMVMRDQNSSYTKLASVSTDNGETWTKAVKTNMPDSRSKQSAGNLPDGTAFFASNPVNNKNRQPLVLTLSADGQLFNKAYLLRAGGSDLQAQRTSGKSKGLGYIYPKSMVDGDYLYVAHSTNKEDVEYVRIPLAAIMLNTDGIQQLPYDGTAISTADDATYPTYSIAGQQVDATYRGIVIRGGRKFVQR